MASFEGSLRNPDESVQPIRVFIDLTDERLRISSGGIEIGNWRLGEIQISAQHDGFHIRRAGEDLILNMTQDAEFAVTLDLRSVPVGLARRMAVYRDSMR